jgi:hypothetical protein
MDAELARFAGERLHRGEQEDMSAAAEKLCLVLDD